MISCILRTATTDADVRNGLPRTRATGTATNLVPPFFSWQSSEQPSTVIIPLFTLHIRTCTATALRYEPLTFFHSRFSIHTVHTFHFYSFITSHVSFFLSRSLCLPIPSLASYSIPSKFPPFLFSFLLLYLPFTVPWHLYFPSFCLTISPFYIYISQSCNSNSCRGRRTFKI